MPPAHREKDHGKINVSPYERYHVLDRAASTNLDSMFVGFNLIALINHC